MSSTNSEKTPVPRPNAPSIVISPTLTLQPPLSRRGHGPGLVLLVDPSLDLANCHDKTLDPPPLQKWAEEGYAVAQLKLVPNGVAAAGGLRLDEDDLHQAIQELERLPSCDGARELGFIGKYLRTAGTLSRGLERLVYLDCEPVSLTLFETPR